MNNITEQFKDHPLYVAEITEFIEYDSYYEVLLIDKRHRWDHYQYGLSAFTIYSRAVLHFLANPVQYGLNELSARHNNLFGQNVLIAHNVEMHDRNETKAYNSMIYDYTGVEVPSLIPDGLYDIASGQYVDS